MDNENIKVEREEESILIKHTVETMSGPMERVFHDVLVEVCEDSDEILGIDNFVEYEPDKWMLRLNSDPTKEEIFRLSLMLSGMGGKFMNPISDEEDLGNTSTYEIVEKAYSAKTSGVLVDSEEELRRLVLAEDIGQNQGGAYSEFDV